MAKSIHTTYRRIWDTTKRDFVNVQLTIEVDFEKIAEAMAVKAYVTKSKKATMGRNAIKCTARQVG